MRVLTTRLKSISGDRHPAARSSADRQLDRAADALTAVNVTPATGIAPRGDYTQGIMGKTATRRWQRWTTWVAGGWYVLVMSGLPLFPGLVASDRGSDGLQERLVAAKDRSRPFPCRDNPCGCVSAEQCFKKCCCHTPAQLLAWAKRHDVEPAVLAALQRRADTEIPAIASAPSCCASPVIVAKSTRCTADDPVASSRAVADCCSTGSSSAAAGAARVAVEGEAEVCRDLRSLSAADDPAHQRSATTADDPTDEPLDEPLSRHTVVLRAMLACGGIVAEWFSIGGAPPPRAVVAVACISPLTLTLVDRDESLRPRHVAPDVPPPRVA